MLSRTKGTEAPFCLAGYRPKRKVLAKGTKPAFVLITADKVSIKARAIHLQQVTSSLSDE